MKILDTLWFSSLQTSYGIVLGEDEITGERKAYLGTALGLDEAADTKEIAAWGAPVYVTHALALLKHFAEEKLKTTPEEKPL